MKIVGLAIVACLLCASQTNACDADLDKDGVVGMSDFLIFAAQFGQTCPHTTPDTLSALSVEAGYGRIVLPGTQVQLNATLNGPGAQVTWRQVGGIVAEVRSANALQPIISIPVMINQPETLLFEVRAEKDSGQQDSDIVWVEAYVPQQDVADLTLVADFSPRNGWACDRDPVAVPEVQTRVLENTIEYTTNGIPRPCDGAVSQSGKSKYDSPSDANLAHSPLSRKDEYTYCYGYIWHHAGRHQTRTRYRRELSQPAAVELRGADSGYGAAVERQCAV